MIVVVFWGTRLRTEDRGAVAPARCPSCHHKVFFRRIVTESTSHVFFIPLGRETYHELACSGCALRVSLDGELLRAAGTMSADTIRWQGGMMADDDYVANAARFWETVSATEVYHGPRIDPTIELGRDAADAETAAGWFPDPTGRHDRRFFDGDSWTAYVLDGETTSSDTFLTPAGPGWYPDPQLRHELRYWDGRAWTDQTRDADTLAVDEH